MKKIKILEEEKIPYDEEKKKKTTRIWSLWLTASSHEFTEPIGDKIECSGSCRQRRWTHILREEKEVVN